MTTPIRFRYTVDGPKLDLSEYVVGKPDLDTCFMVATDGAISFAEYRARVARVTDPVLRAQMESGDWATQSAPGSTVPPPEEPEPPEPEQA